MPYETSEWGGYSGYSITAAILVIIAIIMIIVAIVWYEQESAKPVADQSFTGVTLLFVGGIVFFVIALFVGYSGRSRRPVMTNEYSTQTTHLGSPGCYPGPHQLSANPGYGMPVYSAPQVWGYSSGNAL